MAGWVVGCAWTPVANESNTIGTVMLAPTRRIPIFLSSNFMKWL
jgi:hypothetical protein